MNTFTKRNLRKYIFIVSPLWEIERTFNDFNRALNLIT